MLPSTHGNYKAPASFPDIDNGILGKLFEKSLYRLKNPAIENTLESLEAIDVFTGVQSFARWLMVALTTEIREHVNRQKVTEAAALRRLQDVLREKVRRGLLILLLIHP
jgi:hypothetical protein